MAALETMVYFCQAIVNPIGVPHTLLNPPFNYKRMEDCARLALLHVVNQTADSAAAKNVRHS
jgi:hypothetical protein